MCLQDNEFQHICQSKISQNASPKSTLREALEPTWTALGRPGAKTLKKDKSYQNLRVHFGVDFGPFLRRGVHPGLSGTENGLLLFETCL